MAIKIPQVQPFWKNPVLVRDMRVGLRGTRAFWSQAIYLLLLIVLATAGYGSAVRMGDSGVLDPITIQYSLQAFYYFIFETLAVLITLIAPALTAATIVTERQRLTLDLLVTTPMSAWTMLTGKLMSSIAFLGLLLFLSIPASALCIVLGGATIFDVLRVYMLLITDGIVLAAVGLAVSCTRVTSIRAVMGTYAIIALFDIFTGATGAASAVSTGMHGAGAGLPFLTFVMLNPFCAVALQSSAVSILGLSVPIWIATPVVAALLVRLLITNAAMQIGMYGGGLVASFRRQLLFVTLLVMFLAAQSMPLSAGSSPSEVRNAIALTICVMFAISLLFLPSLFVPYLDDDAPAGLSIRGWYNVRSMFIGSHDGSLPFFHLWLLVAFAGTFAGFYSSIPPGTGVAFISAASLFYVSGVGFLYWSLSRISSLFSQNAAASRPLAFGLLAFVLLVPLAILVMWQHSLPDGSTFNVYDSWLGQIWLGHPFSDASGPGIEPRLLLISGSIAYLLGLVVYPFWKPIAPGSKLVALFAGRKRSDAAGRIAA